MTSPVELVAIGAGGRGYRAYGRYAERNPEKVRFVAVAEPDETRRDRFAEAHAIPPERQFGSWEELLGRPQLACGAINTTQDRTHHASTLALLAAGYDVLLEKPMATTPSECVDLVRTAAERGRNLQICHVLRYAPFFRTVHDLVTGGRLGDIVSFQWNENLVYWHYAHSFVRGNWGNAGRSGIMLLTKCCHDLDLLVWMLGRPIRLASSGSLTHFRPDKIGPVSGGISKGVTPLTLGESSPSPDSVGPNIPDRCTDGCPIADECPYFAPRLYIERDPGEWARDPISLDHSRAALLRGLETGPYGRCVYRCDNDVVDHQVVTLQFASGLSASLTMQGSSYVEGRTLRVDGMRATLLGNEARNLLEVHDHLTGEVQTFQPQVPTGTGHGGGDAGVMDAFVQSLNGNGGGVLTSATESLVSHLLAFAGEEARTSHQVIDVDAYWKRFGA